MANYRSSKEVVLAYVPLTIEKYNRSTFQRAHKKNFKFSLESQKSKIINPLIAFLTDYFYSIYMSLMGFSVAFWNIINIDIWADEMAQWVKFLAKSLICTFFLFKALVSWNSYCSPVLLLSLDCWY